MRFLPCGCLMSTQHKIVDREVLLVEYQKAQDSAEHHDVVVGNVTSLWLGSAILMGFVLTALASKHPDRYRVVLTMLIVLGMLSHSLSGSGQRRPGGGRRISTSAAKRSRRSLG